MHPALLWSVIKSQVGTLELDGRPDPDGADAGPATEAAAAFHPLRR